MKKTGDIANLKVTVEINEITWTCGDCGNRYDNGVMECPNRRLDLWVIQAGKR